MSRWGLLFWMGLAALVALVPLVTKRKPETPVDQWADVYRTCVGSHYPTDQQRAECIAAADRVLACDKQKGVE